MVTISIKEYVELIRAAERIDTLERLLQTTNGYLSIEDVKGVLCINTEKRCTGNAEV